MLRRFAAGELALDALSAAVRQQVFQGPQFILYDQRDPDVAFSPDLECAFYLDMELDAEPAPDERSLRSMTRALVAALEAAGDMDPLAEPLLQLARSAEQTEARITDLCEGRLPLPGWQRFVRRRAWDESLISTILALPRDSTCRLGKALRDNDFETCRRILVSGPA